MKNFTIALAALAGILQVTCSYAGDLETPSNKICILNYNVESHPISMSLTRIISKTALQNILLKSEAIPSDFLQCIQDRYSEIMVIAHALRTGGKQDTDAVNLGYFRKMNPEERRSSIERSILNLEDKIKTFKRTHAEERKHNYETHRPGELNPKEAEINRLEIHLGKIKRIPDEKKLYVVKPFMPRVLSLAREELSRQHKDGTQKLKKIRFMNCFPQQVWNRYPDLQALVQENGIDFQFAPLNKFWSWILNAPVSSFSKSWVKRVIKESSNNTEYQVE